MVKSDAEVFRNRQSIADLAELVQQHRSALDRLAETPGQLAVLLEVCQSGFRLPRPDTQNVYTRLLHAAALPDDDFPAFTAATAILLANRLAEVSTDDDLYWNWDAFREHYLLAEPKGKAALMNGYRCLADFGRVSLENGPDDGDCLSLPLDAVMTTLDTSGDALVVQAIADQASPTEAGALWQQETAQGLQVRRLPAFRYLYERPGSMAPPDAETAALIPWQ